MQSFRAHQRTVPVILVRLGWILDQKGWTGLEEVGRR